MSRKPTVKSSSSPPASDSDNKENKTAVHIKTPIKVKHLDLLDLRNKFDSSVNISLPIELNNKDLEFECSIDFNCINNLLAIGEEDTSNLNVPFILEKEKKSKNKEQAKKTNTIKLTIPVEAIKKEWLEILIMHSSIQNGFNLPVVILLKVKPKAIPVAYCKIKYFDQLEEIAENVIKESELVQIQSGFQFLHLLRSINALQKTLSKFDFMGILESLNNVKFQEFALNLINEKKYPLTEFSEDTLEKSPPTPKIKKMLVAAIKNAKYSSTAVFALICGDQSLTALTKKPSVFWHMIYESKKAQALMDFARHTQLLHPLLKKIMMVEEKIIDSHIFAKKVYPKSPFKKLIQGLQNAAELKKISKDLSQINTLLLNQSQMPENTHLNWEILAKALEHNHSVRDFYVAWQLSSVNINNLLKLFKTNTRIHTFDLATINLNDEHLQKLSKNLLGNTSLNRLSLSGHFSTSGMTAIGDLLSSNKSIHELFINGVDSAGAIILMQSLQGNQSLFNLKLRLKWDDEVANNLDTLLLKNHSLETLELDFDTIHPSLIENLDPALAQNKTLTTLKIFAKTLPEDQNIDFEEALIQFNSMLEFFNNTLLILKLPFTVETMPEYQKSLNCVYLNRMGKINPNISLTAWQETQLLLDKLSLENKLKTAPSGSIEKFPEIDIEDEKTKITINLSKLELENLKNFKIYCYPEHPAGSKIIPVPCNYLKMENHKPKLAMITLPDFRDKIDWCEFTLGFNCLTEFFLKIPLLFYIETSKNKIPAASATVMMFRLRNKITALPQETRKLFEFAYQVNYLANTFSESVKNPTSELPKKLKVTTQNTFVQNNLMLLLAETQKPCKPFNQQDCKAKSYPIIAPMFQRLATYDIAAKASNKTLSTSIIASGNLSTIQKLCQHYNFDVNAAADDFFIASILHQNISIWQLFLKECKTEVKVNEQANSDFTIIKLLDLIIKPTDKILAKESSHTTLLDTLIKIKNSVDFNQPIADNLSVLQTVIASIQQNFNEDAINEYLILFNRAKSELKLYTEKQGKMELLPEIIALLKNNHKFEKLVITLLKNSDEKSIQLLYQNINRLNLGDFLKKNLKYLPKPYTNMYTQMQSSIHSKHNNTDNTKEKKQEYSEDSQIPIKLIEDCENLSKQFSKKFNGILAEISESTNIAEKEIQKIFLKDKEDFLREYEKIKLQTSHNELAKNYTELNNKFKIILAKLEKEYNIIAMYKKSKSSYFLLQEKFSVLAETKKAIEESYQFIKSSGYSIDKNLVKNMAAVFNNFNNMDTEVQSHQQELKIPDQNQHNNDSENLQALINSIRQNSDKFDLELYSNIINKIRQTEKNLEPLNTTFESLQAKLKLEKAKAESYRKNTTAASALKVKPKALVVPSKSTNKNKPDEKKSPSPNSHSSHIVSITSNHIDTQTDFTASINSYFSTFPPQAGQSQNEQYKPTANLTPDQDQKSEIIIRSKLSEDFFESHAIKHIRAIYNHLLSLHFALRNPSSSLTGITKKIQLYTQLFYLYKLISGIQHYESLKFLSKKSSTWLPKEGNPNPFNSKIDPKFYNKAKAFLPKLITDSNYSDDLFNRIQPLLKNLSTVTERLRYFDGDIDNNDLERLWTEYPLVPDPCYKFDELDSKRVILNASEIVINLKKWFLDDSNEIKPMHPQEQSIVATIFWPLLNQLAIEYVYPVIINLSKKYFYESEFHSDSKDAISFVCVQFSNIIKIILISCSYQNEYSQSPFIRYCQNFNGRFFKKLADNVCASELVDACISAQGFLENQYHFFET